MLLDHIKKLPEYTQLLSGIRSGKNVISLYGVSPVHRAHIAAALHEDMNAPLFIITRDEQSAGTFAADYAAFSGSTAGILPQRDLVFHNIEGASREYEHMRIGALWQFHTGKATVLASYAEAVMLRTIPPETLERAVCTIAMDEDYDVNAICARLVTMGYTRFDTVEGPGQFALRGGIMDIFPVGEAAPIRCEFFGDTVDSLGTFDPMTQRRTENVKSVTLLPARETLPLLADDGVEGLCKKLRKLAGAKNASEDLKNTLNEDIARLEEGRDFPAADRYIPQIYPQFASSIDYCPEDTIFIICDTPAVLDGMKGVAFRQSEDIPYLMGEGILPPGKSGYTIGTEQLKAELSRRGVTLMDNFLGQTPGLNPEMIISLSAKQLPSFGGGLDVAVKDISAYVRSGYGIFAMAGGEQRAKKLAEILIENGLPATRDIKQAREGVICVLPENFSAGGEYPALKLAFLCEGVQQQVRKKRPKKSGKNRVKSFSDLSPGDLVVHDTHGIGRFVNVERIQVDKVWRDYIKIAFAGTDFVYVPATSLDMISKYIGNAEVEGVKLSKLGGTAWIKSKQRAKKSALDLADSLIALYAERQARPGFAFEPDDDWQRSFEEAFPFDETEDQLICAREIKKDMQEPYPMDRLLCGDVGFGKTEVAFRAIMKCVLSGKQAAILVPTTVLARQHFLTASQRFSGYPFKIEMMSRFRTKKQLEETVRKVKNGQCDLLIGTHRIIQKDIEFKNLGLLVVDEEQRFGVSHKERIKQMSVSVDVLTLTATPIPRTLNMAMSGIRDMSVLEEAPVGRHPVQTYVLEHDDRIVFDAIRRELSRDGQVYYLHNRIESIDAVAGRIQREFPEHTVGIAHGRMGEETLSDTMNRMYSGDISVLVCTTIIETGLDIPNVNTLIIENADNMGLAQLHQIRGRVGRSPRHAYAYFTYRRGKVLTEISQKRLSAIREFAEFGSGIKIAMRDLEIRGAGNVLGAEQSGHMTDVGYDMYLRLLEEATRELKGEPPVARTDCTADILVSAGIPETYVPDSAARIDLYRRIAMISGDEDYSDMQDELIDRFGEIPKQTEALLRIAVLRGRASALGIYEISQKENRMMFYFKNAALENMVGLCSLPVYKGRLLLSAGEKPYLNLKLKSGEDPLTAASELVKCSL